jgi:putative ABC transport system permease protein
MIFKIAFRNVMSAGLRTWLNIIVLSLTLTVIVLLQGVYNGLFTQISGNRINEELGQGQLWHNKYDPFDPLSLSEAHAAVSPAVQKAEKKREAISILMVMGSAYPKGRITPAILKGIPADQEILKLPFDKLKLDSPRGTMPAMIGRRMAKQTELSIGDILTVRWRNSLGAYNAEDLSIVHIFDSLVPTIDNGQIWLSLDDLQKMNMSPGHATIVVFAKPIEGEFGDSSFLSKTLDKLLADTYEFVKMKSSGGMVFYIMMIFLAMIAIFDTQALSIFKRRKEIGTLMALGMTNRQITATFTLEGVLHGVLAAIISAIYASPLIWYLQTYGYSFGVSSDQLGLAIGDRYYPDYTVGLVVQSVLIVMLILTVVSYLPARKITKLQPYDALRGRWS